MSEIPTKHCGTSVNQIGAELVRNGIEDGKPLRAVITGTLQSGPRWSSSTQVVVGSADQAMDLAYELIDVAMRWFDTDAANGA